MKVLVIGDTSGIGKGLADEFYSQGFEVIGASRIRLRTKLNRASRFYLDVTESSTGWSKAYEDHFRSADMLIYSAAISTSMNFLSAMDFLDRASALEDLKTNVWGQINVASEWSRIKAETAPEKRLPRS